MIPKMSGISNTSTMSFTGLPTNLQPSTQHHQQIICLGYDDSSRRSVYAYLVAGGTVNFAAQVDTGSYGTASFTNSGGKGFVEATTITYKL